MVKVLSINLFSYDIDTLIKVIKLEISKKVCKNCCISATGAHRIIIAQKDKKFEEILNSFYANLPNGMPEVWVGRLKGAKEMERCYGPDFFRDTSFATKDEKINHLILILFIDKLILIYVNRCLLVESL